jgi:hypothetical protein
MKGPLRKNIFTNDLESLYETNTTLSESGNNAFYALSTFDEQGTREAAHAQYVRAIFADLDCGTDLKTGKQKAFASKKAAVSALVEFMDTTGLSALGMPWLVDSGGGVHAYWPLTQDATIEAWKPVAEAFKRAAQQHGLPIDMTVTADAARVLRMPGTLNWKYTPPKPVVLKQRGTYFSLTGIATALAPYAVAPKKPDTSLALAGTRPQAAGVSSVAQALLGNSVTYFKNIMVRTAAGTGCGQIADYIARAAEDGMEPLWRGLLSITKPCADGDKAARKLSALHPYDEDRMYAKLAEIKGPYPCAKLDSENPGICGQCPHWGKITNPLALGREVMTLTTATAEAEQDAPQDVLQEPQRMLPTPPYGFEYGRISGVYYRKPAEKDEEDKLLLLVPFDFYMTRMIRDLDSTQAEFRVTKGDKQFTFAIPTAEAIEARSCLKVLAKNNVMAAHAALDAYLYQYVRQSIQNASANGEEIVVPQRFGWQADGSFAVHDTVFSPISDEKDFKFASDRLHNVINATRPNGSLDNWRSVFEMMRRKAATDPVVWGHLAAAGIGFGTILMQFTPHGSRAGVFHACSPGSGAGKTFAQSMAVSVWGENGRYMVAPSTSERTMMQRAGMLGSLMLGVDEITSKNRSLAMEWLPSFIFDYAAGMHKIKGSASSNSEVTQELLWSAIAFISSNTPGLEAMMGARKHTSEGEARRHLEWQTPAGYELKWTPEENEIRSRLEHNTGVAGPLFAKWCVRNINKVQFVMQQVLEHWRKISGARDDERFWTAMVVSVVAGYVLAGRKYANIVDIPATPIFEFFLKLVVRQRRIIASNQKSATDTLNAYIAEYMGNFIKTEGSQVMQHLVGGAAIQPSSAKTQVRGRVEYNVTPGHVDFYIEMRLLKLHCADSGLSYEAFVTQLQDNVTVDTVRKNLLAGTKGPEMRVPCLKITRTIADVEATEEAYGL